jgi:hypothetical protein
VNRDGRKVLPAGARPLWRKKAELGIKAIGREVMGADGGYELRERDVSYSANFFAENSVSRPGNPYFLNISV